MKKTIYKINRMDCPCEENLIRLSLQDEVQIVKLDFNIPDRTLTVYHDGRIENISSKLDSLNLDSCFMSSIITDNEISHFSYEDIEQRKALWIVLAINGTFFLLEMTTGIISKSMGLIADSLDMLADAFVYGMSLMAVGASLFRKKRVAFWSGIVQILLAFLGLTEIIKRFIGIDDMPDFRLMIIISMIALIANSFCLWLLQRTKSQDAHIKASIIFSANDVIINLGVIAAAVLVWILNSNLPDLIIGLIVFVLVIRGGIRILKLSR